MTEPLIPITAAQIASLPDTSDVVVSKDRPERVERDEGNVSAAPVPNWARLSEAVKND